MTREPQNELTIESLADHLSVGVLVFERQGDGRFYCSVVNRFAESVLGMKGDDLESLCAEDIDKAHETDSLVSHLNITYGSGHPSSFDWAITIDQVKFHLSCTIQAENGIKKSPRLIATIADRSAEKQAEQHLIHAANYDPLTGLPNRTYFTDRVEEAINTFTDDENRNCAILLINVDRFQVLNESFGHLAGDEFLISLGLQIRHCLRDADVLARLSGDEYAVLIRNLPRIDTALEISDRIHEISQRPYSMGKDDLYYSVSIGISSTFSSNPHAEDLLRDADFAMHRAKDSGKARTEVYERDTHVHARSLYHLETELRKAVDNEDLELHYQPIINLETGKLTGFEALARWIHPEKGFISPAEFIPVAEEAGIIVPLGRWALRRACEDLASWQSRFKTAKDISVSVNVSGIQFARDDVVREAQRAMDFAGIDPKSFKLELTESTLIENSDMATQVLEDLRALGIGIYLDDFGTGYSSLSYLHRFPLDVVKVDRAFICDIETNLENRRLAEIIFMLAQNFKMGVIAEGIETVGQAKILSDAGYKHGQGYLFSKPLPIKDVVKLLADDPVFMQD